MDFVTAFTKDQIQKALAQAPTPYNLGTPQAAGLSIVNNSQYPVEIRSGSALVNVVQPNSEMTLNTVPEVSLSLVTSAPGLYIPPDPIVTVTYLTTAQGYSQNALAPQTATVISGNVQADISGPVSAEIVGSPTVNLAAGTAVSATILNSSLSVSGSVDANITNATLNATVTGDVNATITNASINAQVTGTVDAHITNANINAQIVGSPTVQLAEGTSVSISNSEIPVSISGNPTFQLAAGTSVNATIQNSNVPVTISGTPTVNATIQNASIPVTGDVTVTAAQAIPITNTEGGIVQVGGSINATIQNASIPVTGDVTVTAATAIPITNESGGSIMVGGTINLAAGTSVNATITGNPTVNLAAGTSVTATISGTPVVNLAAGAAVKATIQNASIAVTGSVNATIQNSSIPVTLSGTNTVQANIVNSTLPVTLSGTNNVTATINGTPTVNLAAGTSVNVTTGSVNIANTPGVNVQQQPNASGQGYATSVSNVNIKDVQANYKTWQFLPNDAITTCNIIAVQLNNLSNTSPIYTFNYAFVRKYSDGSMHTVGGGWQSFDFQSGVDVETIYDLSKEEKAPFLANAILYYITNNTTTTGTANLNIAITAEVMTSYYGNVVHYTNGSLPSLNPTIDTYLPAKNLLKLLVTVDTKFTANSYCVLRFKINGQEFHHEALPLEATHQQKSFEINLENPLDPSYWQGNQTVQFYVWGQDTSNLKYIGITAVYKTQSSLLTILG